MRPAAKRRKTSAPKSAEATTTTSTQPTPSSSAVATTQYPGFDPWHATLELDPGASSLPKFDASKAEFVHSAKIYDTDDFKLKPLTVADGPLKGRHVLMLEPITDFFGFMDLPAEIRNIIYGMVFEEREDIVLETFRSKYQAQRAVRRGFLLNSKHMGMSWDAKTSSWSGQTPSSHALLQVSRQINAEAATVAYGNNHFRFNGLPELRAFLDGIGTMRRYLRHIAFDYGDYHRTLATPAFHKLKDAKNLQSLVFVHGTICDKRYQRANGARIVPLQQLASDLKPLMKAVQKAQKSSVTPLNVLDIVTIGPEKFYKACEDGKIGKSCRCYRYVCNYACSERDQHMDEVRSRFRKALADGMGIEEASS